MSLVHSPGAYSSAHGDLIFTVLDATKAGDPVTYPDYKYVCDVYDNGNLVVRLKSFPHPDSKVGIFSISSIARSFLNPSFFNPVPSVLLSNVFGLGGFFCSSQVKFGEEYGFTTFVNIIEDAERNYYNNYNGRLLGQSTSLTDCLDKVMTVRPYATPIYRNSKFCLIPFLPTDSSDVTLIIKAYNGGGLVGTVSKVYSPPDVSANVQMLFNVSPDAINVYSSGFISSYITYYTVEFNTTNIVDDSIYRFNLVCEPRHEVFTLHFLNRFGGFESRDFTKVSRKTIAIEKSEFGKLPYTMDSSGNIAYYNANKVYNETRSIYAGQYKEKMTLNTDILTDAEYRWLADLVLSPAVYIEMSSYFIPIIITENNYDFKKTINDDLTNLTLNIEFGDQFNTQFR